MRRYLPLLAIVLWGACSNPQQDAQKFIDQYTKTYVDRYTASSQAAWKTNIDIKEGDTVNAYNSRVADEALAAFTGSVENIEQAQKFLAQKDKLSPLQVRQLEIILYKAGSDPQTVSALVKEKIRASVAQTEKLFGFAYTLDGKPVSTNDIDNILKTENNEQKRLAAWSASKEVGKALKPGLVNLRRLRNETVQALKYPDFFSYQVSDYGLTTPEMMELMKRLNQELRPLFRELHTYARYTLAKKYGAKEVPDYLPAHWLPNRWGQDWSAMLDVKGLNVDSVLAAKTPQWIVQEGEAFYKSLGFEALPASFWERSSLYPYPPDSVVKKNNHASAWHVDLQNDLRSLMSIETNAEWFETSNHELGHIYYYQSYTTPQVPPLLREGANRAFHEAIGSMMGMAAMQKPYLIGRGLIAPGTKTDSIQILLKEALNFAVFIPFAAGTMSEFEKALYADNLSESEFNKKWWELTKQYQGIVPPSDRDEIYCDAATKTHINDDAAQYYDYALSYVILFQLHQHIAEKILHQDARATNYFGNKETGEFLKKIMAPGASRNWRDVLKEATGEDMNATAMVRYFEPLMQWLKKENQGRKYTLPEQL
ncbi:M2 family metallopeptidase [Dawidia soli]|uniref:M2 family metallopeptidase n=1 Tax=Dawidia soli TaxID=2782352 RepID=A0AAP2GKY9_9BACT|nr:M2 family metallopeptidase [Dawidia soli]MBT1690035.1 M2 family metallopeptidase [Dawidia soli]